MNSGSRTGRGASRRWVLAFGLAMVVASCQFGAPALGQVQEPGEPVPGSGTTVVVTTEPGDANVYRLALSGDPAVAGPVGAFYRTTRPISHARLIEVDPPKGRVIPPGSNVRTQVVLWNELGPDGKLWPHRALRHAGSHAEDLGEDNPPLGSWDDRNRDGVDDLGFVCIGDIDYRIMLRYAEFNPVAVSSVDGADPALDLEPWALGEPAITGGMSAREVPAYDTNGDSVPDPSGCDGGGCHLYLVQFWTQALDEYRRDVLDAGGIMRKYMPEEAFVVEASADAINRIAALPCVRWVGPFHPAYRFDERLLNAYGRESFDARAIPTQRYDFIVLNAGPGRNAALADRIAAIGAALSEHSSRGSLMSATLSGEQLLAVLRLDQVLWVDRWTGGGEDMVNARVVGGAVLLESSGFTGAGVRGEVMDGNLNFTHPDWSLPTMPPTSRVIRHGTEQGGGPDATNHGTATYGIAFGDGTGRVTAKGMLFGAGHGVDTEGGGIFATYNRLMQFGGSNSRFDHTAELVGYQTTTNFRAVFQSNSWGSNPEFTNDDPPVPKYTSRSADLDDILWRMDLVACQSMGNTGNRHQTRPEAWAKNVVAVGGVDHKDTSATTDDTWPQVPYNIPRSQDCACGTSHYPPCCSSTPCPCCPNATCFRCTVPPGQDQCCTTGGSPSFGPAPDGRFKPDLCHFYDRVETAMNPNFGDTADHTCYFNGTSAATPIVAGHFGLLFQIWHNSVFDGFGGAPTVFASKPRMTTARALLINTARQYAFGSPNQMTRERQGWGLPNLRHNDGTGLYDLRHNILIINETHNLSSVGQSASYELTVDPALDLKVTMVYADPAGAPNSSVNRVNDIHLTLTAPGGATYYGNSGLASGRWTTSPGSADKYNTIENIFIENPQAGTWIARVELYTLQEDGDPETTPPTCTPTPCTNFDIDFALVVTGLTDSASRDSGDWNGDGVVDLADLLLFVSDFLEGAADVDRSGATESIDFFDFVERFLSGR